MKNILVLVTILSYSICNAQKCKFDKNATDEDGNNIVATKAKIITSMKLGSSNYIFARGLKTDEKTTLELDIRAPKKFTINSECKLSFLSSSEGNIDINFNEFKISHYTKVADHSSYWKLKTKVPITDTVFKRIINSNIEAIQWNTQEEDTIQKKLKKKNQKNLFKLLHCLKDEDKETPQETTTKKQGETISQAENSKSVTEKTIIKETTKEPIKSLKEKEIEKSIIIPKEKASDD